MDLVAETKELFAIALSNEEWEDHDMKRLASLMKRLGEMEAKVNFRPETRLIGIQTDPPAEQISQSSLIGQIFDLTDPFARLSREKALSVFRQRCPQITRKELKTLLLDNGFTSIKTMGVYRGLKLRSDFPGSGSGSLSRSIPSPDKRPALQPR
jgi:hypothetical protein